MKKRSILLLTVGMLLCVFACDDTATTTATTTEAVVLSIADITLTQGDSAVIDYTIAPAGTFGVVTFEITSQTPSGVIAITGTTLSALLVGTAAVEATVTNMAGAARSFSATTTFDVTVEAIPVIDGEHLVNGGFELGLDGWTVTSTFGPDAYGTSVVANVPHGGEAALNLWYDDNADTLGEALDLTISETIVGLPAGTYLFSLWFQGAIESVAMTASAGLEELETGTFSGNDYQPVPDHDGYVNYGIQFTLSAADTVTVEAAFVGVALAWGFVDDVSLKLGTLDDLLVVPPTGEDGYADFIAGGDFSSLSSWMVEITGSAASKSAILSGGRLALWTNGLATFKIYQTVTLPAATYNLCIYLNGGIPGAEFNVDDGFIYVKSGDIVQSVDLVPEGWGSGTMKRIELSNLILEGTVEVGIYVNTTSGANNWINLDDFTLWSYDIVTMPTAAAVLDGAQRCTRIPKREPERPDRVAR